MKTYCWGEFVEDVDNTHEELIKEKTKCRAKWKTILETAHMSKDVSVSLFFILFLTVHEGV